MRIVTLGTAHGDPTFCRFNSSILLECGASGYLLDAGSPVTALLVRRGYDFNRLKTVTISHMHLDHFGGLPDLIKHQCKYDRKLKIFLPEKNSAEIFELYYAMSHRRDTVGRIEYTVIEAGVFFEDENVKMTAIPTKHCHGEDGAASYATLIESARGNVLYTGDLKADFSDFPFAVCEKAQLCLCELTHWKLEEQLEKLRELTLQKLVFVHVGNRFHDPKEIKLLTKLTENFPYPVILAYDGDEFTL